MTLPLADVASYGLSATAAPGTRILYVQAPGFPRTSLAARLRDSGVETTMAADVADTLRLLGEDTFAACLVDLAGGRGALTTVRLIRARHGRLSVVGVVDAASPAMAAEATHAGLSETITWPFDAVDLTALLADLRDRAAVGERDATGRETVVEISQAMRDVMRQVREAAGSVQSVLLAGSAGSGRRLLAATLHQASPEADGPLVVVECGGQAPSALEAELFGPSAAGAAPSDVMGAVVVEEGSAVFRARGGTLVLTDLDEAPSRVQTRLSSLLRDREIVVGSSTRPIDVNVRVVATLASGTVESGAGLRPDLAARFGVRIEVPTLRRRREDIPLIATHYLVRRAEGDGGPALRFSRAALELLAALPWPGNIPELERVIDAVASDTRRPIVQIEDVLGHISFDGVPRLSGGHSLREARELFERECIEAALARSQGRVGSAAKSLGIQRTNLYRKVRQLGISRTLLSSHR